MKPLVITGYGSCLKVRGGNLVLLDQEARESGEWAPATFLFDTIVCDLIGGFVTFPALRWFEERGAVLSLRNFDGRPVFSAFPTTPANVRTGSSRCGQT